MRLSIIPALILLATTVVAAADDPAPASGTCCAAAAPTTVAERPWYIGPKGGDLRQGKNRDYHRTAADATPAAAAIPVATAVAERPWYIGPKGGDVRKGQYAELYSGAQVLVVAAPTHCSRYVAPAVGPKGGILLSKGQSTTAVLAAADAACQALCTQ